MKNTRMNHQERHPSGCSSVPHKAVPTPSSNAGGLRQKANQLELFPAYVHWPTVTWEELTKDEK